MAFKTSRKPNPAAIYLLKVEALEQGVKYVHSFADFSQGLSCRHCTLYVYIVMTPCGLFYFLKQQLDGALQRIWLLNWQAVEKYVCSLLDVVR